MIDSIAMPIGVGVQAAQLEPHRTPAGNRVTTSTNLRPAADAGMHGNTAQYRYHGRNRPLHSISDPVGTRRTRRSPPPPDGNTTAAPVSTTADIDNLLLLRPGEPGAHGKTALDAVLDYANICNASATTDVHGAITEWWARLRGYPSQYAKDDLERIDHNLRTVFFETPPQRRAAEWQRISASARRDINLILDLAEIIRTAERPYADMSYDAILPPVAQALAAERTPNLDLRDTDTPYLLSLTQALRERNATGDAYFQNRVEIMPSDVLAFVKTGILQRDTEQSVQPEQSEQPEPSDRFDPAYRQDLEQDLCALLYRALHDTCRNTADDPLTLSSLRRGIAGALQAEEKDHGLLAVMFADKDRPEAIYHDGWVLRNARGKTPDDLVAYLGAHGPSELASLHHAYKLSLVRRKLYQLGEYAGDYAFGSVKRAMATVLMRTSNRPAGNRHIVYANATAVEEHWVGRIQQEIERGDMPYMLEIVEAVYNEHANGVEEWNTQAYRTQYGKVLQTIETAAARYDCNAEAQASIWRWLAGHMPGWQAASRNFDDAISIGQYAASIESAVDAFYQIAQAGEFPRFVTTDIMTALGMFEFHPLLAGLSQSAGRALSQAAGQFDYAAFHKEHTVSDKQNPAYTLIQKMENTFYRNTRELRAPPFWSVETEAYRLLLASNITLEQITEGLASIYSTVHTEAYFQRPRPVYEAFIAVIRNVDADALLLLPNGRTIKPYRLIKQSYDNYHKGLEKHPWIIGCARQQLFEKKLPFLPSVQKAEIKRIAKTHSVVSITTESGTEAADELLGSLPIFAPTLQLARALRDDKSHKLYYVLLVARDVLATAAMGKMIFAAYVTPFIMGMRLSASALLAMTTIPRKAQTGLYRLRAGSLGFTQFDIQRRRQQKPEKHDIPIIGGPGGLNKQTARTRSGGQAAHRLAAEQKMNNGTLINAAGASINPDIWLQLMTLIAPALSKNSQQFHAMLKISGKSQSVVFNMTNGNNIENAGVRAGLKGLTSADAFTLCESDSLEERQTVQDATAWQIKSLDDNAYDRRPVHDNLQINFAGNVDAVWSVHPDWRYDPQDIIEKTYDASVELQRLFNLYDSRPVHPRSIKIKVDTQCAYPQLNRRGPASDIVLPADPNCLPFVVTARHVAKQSMTSALIESLVTTILLKVMRDDPAPRRPTHERGLAIWLANRIRLQSDPHADPRVSASDYASREEAQYLGTRTIRDAAELEDQYLERVNPEDPIAVRLHKFPAIANNPTIRAVTNLATRIGMPAYLRSRGAAQDDRPAGAHAPVAASGGFIDRFRHRFAIDTGSRNDADIDRFIETTHLFFKECHDKSPLFQRLFDHGLRRREQQWVIFPDGYAGDGGIEHDILIPSKGIINAAAENALYLGLIDVEQHPDNASIWLPTSSLRPLEPFRRMLDGVIAALGGEQMLLPLESAYEHRGAVSWASDMVLLEAMQDAENLPNKRLAQISVSAENADDCRRLRKMAVQRREQARDEDAWLDHWFATVSNIASP